MVAPNFSVRSYFAGCHLHVAVEAREEERPVASKGGRVWFTTRRSGEMMRTRAQPGYDKNTERGLVKKNGVFTGVSTLLRDFHLHRFWYRLLYHPRTSSPPTSGWLQQTLRHNHIEESWEEALSAAHDILVYLRI